MKLQVTGHFLFLLGISIWFGALVFLGYGVAPVNFSTAEAWEMTGTNPAHPEIEQHARNIGGELTARSIERLNQLEMIAILLCGIGLAIFWFVRFNRPHLLIAQTSILCLMIVIFLIYGHYIANELAEIRALYPLDFAVTDELEKSVQRLRFDSLHQWYTRLSGVNIILALSQIALSAAQYSGLRYGIKEP